MPWILSNKLSNLTMALEIYRKIVSLVVRASELARSVGISNLLQPGLVKEMIIADHLGHELLTTKDGADAHDINDPSILYEYLSCKEGGSGQLDRMFKEPASEREKSMSRIWRNKMIYYAIFYENEQIRAKVIYEITPEALAAETERQLDRSRNAISHVGFSNKWAQENGRVVYQDQRKI